MGASAARITDQGFGICTSHSPSPINTGGMILTGSGNVFINGLGAGTITSIVLGYCGHVGLIITGSGTVITNGQGQARVGDMFAGSYTGIILTGSGNVYSG